MVLNDIQLVCGDSEGRCTESPLKISPERFLKTIPCFLPADRFIVCERVWQARTCFVVSPSIEVFAECNQGTTTFDARV